MKKMIFSKWSIFFYGFVLGMLVFGFYKYRSENNVNKVYFKLKKDYCIENIGYLKSGTSLQLNKGMSEGFTRYILYLNLSDGEEVEQFKIKEKDVIIPYWLNYKDSTCNGQ